MAAFTFTLPAIRGVQAGREYFVTMCPLDLVASLFPLEAKGIRPELQLQRILNGSRVPEIARYLAAHPRSYVLPSLTASVDRDVVFEPVAGAHGPAVVGYLRIPLGSRLLLHDGLHRRAAIETALKQRPELAKETVSLVLFVDPGLRHAEQMFTDLKRHEAHSARSRSILFDHRDEMARLVKAVVARVPVFAGLTEMARSTISNRSVKLFTLSGIYHATAALLSGKQQESFGKKLTLAAEYWQEIARHIPDWQRALDHLVTTAELRKNYIHAHALALAALARAGKVLIEEPASARGRKLSRLSSLDWSRGNTTLWEGRAMIAGRLSKATACVILTGNVIKRHLRLDLTPEEEEAEARFAGRTR
jgi:DNA sulfur modification protein DndB